MARDSQTAEQGGDAITGPASGGAGARDPIDVVQNFLAAFAGGDVDTALALMDPDIVYTNVGLNTLRGRRKAGRVIELLSRPGTGFGVHTATAAASGRTVLTERVDEVRVGRLHIRFWVFGKFTVADGRITLWRDHFDFLDCAKGFIRALAGIAVPALNRTMPG